MDDVLENYIKNKILVIFPNIDKSIITRIANRVINRKSNDPITNELIIKFVAAHIRHNLTCYDYLLNAKKMNKAEARTKVQKTIIGYLGLWSFNKVKPDNLDMED